MPNKPQNKFTRSVIERLEQESKKNMLEETKKASPQVTKNNQNNKKIAKVESKKSTIKLDDIINPAKERVAKNKTFYLDLEIIEKLQLEAKNLKMTDSKLVNEILKAVL